MNNESLESPFPQTRQDLSHLKTTALDAARDISSTASVHAQKAQSHLQDLTSHAQEESGEQLDQVKMMFTDLGKKVGRFVAVHPFASIGAALTIGFLVGVTRRACSKGD